LSLFILRDTKKSQKKKRKKNHLQKTWVSSLSYLPLFLFLPPFALAPVFFFSGNDPQINLAKFGYNKLNMKVEVLNHLSVFLATYLNYTAFFF
jgi:hypothetical protein